MKLTAAIFVAVATLISTPLTTQSQAASFSVGLTAPTVSTGANVDVLEVKSRKRSRRHRSRRHRSRRHRNRSYRNRLRYHHRGYHSQDSRNFNSFGHYDFGGRNYRGGFGGFYR